ncbi:hypothetical protein [Streptomyces luteogriseus]|uniref:hypothetical protein n=1 Tax=Streptomyces luteogriseus TaxID=68233 RepID=UPI0038119201
MRIHSSFSTTSSVEGHGNPERRVHLEDGQTNAEAVPCPDGSVQDHWTYVHNNRTGVEGYVSGCFICLPLLGSDCLQGRDDIIGKVHPGCFVAGRVRAVLAYWQDRLSQLPLRVAELFARHDRRPTGSACQADPVRQAVRTARRGSWCPMVGLPGR